MAVQAWALSATQRDRLPHLSVRTASALAVLACVAIALAAAYFTGDQVGSVYTFIYLGFGLCGACAAGYGAWRQRRRLGLVGGLIFGSMFFGFVADIGWNVNVHLFGIDPFPAWTDGPYLLGSLSMIGAGMLMVRRREKNRDATALIDAAMLTVGIGVVTYAFVIVDAAIEPGVTGLGRVVSVAYPVCDVLVAGVVARLLLGAGTASAPAVLLVAAIVIRLFGDVGFAVAVFHGQSQVFPRWIDATYMASYLLIGLAMARPDAYRLTEPVEESNERLGRARLAALAIGTLLAPMTLLASGVAGNVLKVRGAAVGAAVLFLLAMVRMVQLVRAVETQSDLLQILARTDGLTGLANRRTFDHEINRAVELAHSDAQFAVVSVAMIDLDRFKMFNDTYGHAAGDELLRQATSAWSTLLGRLAPAAMLARYGGEEFAVVFPGLDEAGAALVLNDLLAVMPLGQSFSAGVAQHESGEEPAAVVGRADRRLYDAKAAGRACVVGAAPPTMDAQVQAARVAALTAG